MMINSIQERWEKSSSYCIMTQKGNGLVHFGGTYYLEGVAFPFTATEQRNGIHVLRGQVSIFSPGTGKMMKKPGSKNKDGKPETIQTSIYPAPLLVTDKSTWKTAVMERVEKAALSLLNQYRHSIKRDVELGAAPDSLSPQMALLLYGEPFIRCRHGNASEASAKDYLRALSKTFRHLPNKPMKEMTESDVKRALKAVKLSKQAQKLARDFWEFCLDSHYCQGKNPFPTEEKHRKTAKAKQAEADRLDTLSDGMQEELYQMILQNPSGAECGIALMLWGGFTAKLACNFHWEAIRFLKEDKVEIMHFIEDNAGATHNYTRVIAVQAARILKKRYDALIQRYGKTRLKKMPVVSLASTPERAIRADDLNKYGAALLQRLGISRETITASQIKNVAVATRIFTNTYASNLIQKCGLDEDEGLFLFLCSRSLAGNVTADHYRSFTDEDGVELQYAVFRRMAPEEPIELPMSVDRSHEGYDVYYYAPPTTRDHLNLSVELKDLEAGAEVCILDRYGDDVSIIMS